MTTTSHDKTFIYKPVDITPNQWPFARSESRDAEMIAHRIEGENRSLCRIRRGFSGVGLAVIELQLTPTDLREFATGLLNMADYIDANPVRG